MNRCRLFLIHMCVLLLLYGCGGKYDYEVVRTQAYEAEDDGEHGLDAEIVIPAKLSRVELFELGHELRDRWPRAWYLSVQICVPSQYPDHVNGWWATYRCDRPEGKFIDEHIVYLGTPSPVEEEKLKNETPLRGKQLGRWYLYSSTEEQALFLVQKDSVYYMDAHRYSQSGNYRDTARLEEVLENPQTFRDLHFPERVYRLLPDGDLWLSYYHPPGGMTAKKY